MGNNAHRPHPLHIGIDIGGTTVKFCMITQTGEVVERGSVATPRLLDQDEHASFAQYIARALRIADADRTRIASAGIAIPGAVDAEGHVGLIPNARINARGLARAFGETFPTADVRILNDANAAALGEQWAGGARGADDVLLVTLGTGVGAGVIASGRIASGSHGCAGEIGHLRVAENGAACACGGVGCLEQYASARGLVRIMAEECAASGLPAPAFEHDADARAVFAAHAQGNPCASRAVDTFAEKLALGLAGAACMIDPGMILIGGGVSGSFPVFSEKLRASFRAFAIPPCRNTPILCAELGNDAGMIGAARFAMIAAGPRPTSEL